MKHIIIIITLLLSSFCTQANNWEQLFDNNKYNNAKISPNGDYIAISMNYQGKNILVFLDRTNLSTVGTSRFNGEYEAGDFYWVNNERVVIEMVKREPGYEQPQFYGELYAVNYDSSRGKIIYGYQAGKSASRGSRLKKQESIFGWAQIIDVLREDRKHILIQSTPMDDTGERIPSVLKLNVYNGLIKKDLGKSPIPFSHYLTDSDGEIKLVSGTDRNYVRQLYLRKNGEWIKVPAGTVGQSFSLISISESGKYLYTRDNHNQDLFGIFKLNLDDLSYKSLYTDEKVDVTDVELSTDTKAAYAIRVDDGYPAYVIMNPDLEEAKIFKDLLKSFPFSSINITSSSEDGKFYIVSVSSDTDPGTLYLYNKENNKLQSLFRFKPEINNKALFQSEPIQFAASDGNIINGYFTQSESKDKSKLAPVVVLVHGGPHGIRDLWRFSNTVQYLAVNGYSVLQVNYRGSGGYGEKFELDGYKVWGSTIQKDIHEGYQWLVAQKKASGNNVCIMGASFGGYSAVQSATLYPDTYKCVVANAGVYDLELILEENSSRAVKSFWKQSLGTDSQQLKAFSPVNYVERINVPLLLAHGENDEVADIEHVEKLREALDKAKKPYEWFVIDKEGHGFYNPENQKMYMKKVLNFLDKNLK
jgi:dipeptidyl aminopeptidase/acylaminoacyl peptidase